MVDANAISPQTDVHIGHTVTRHVDAGSALDAVVLADAPPAASGVSDC